MTTPPLGKTQARPFPLAARAKALGVILSQEFGTSFRFYDTAQGLDIVQTDGTPSRQSQSRLLPQIVTQLAGMGQSSVTSLADGRYQLLIVLYDAQRPILVAHGLLPGVAGHGSDRMVEQERLQRWSQAVSDRIRLSEQLAAHRHVEEEQSAKATRAWSVVMGIDESIQQVRIHRDSNRSLQNMLKVAQSALGVQALAWIPEEKTGQPMVQGDPLLTLSDFHVLASMLSRHSSEARTGKPVLWNTEQAELWSARFPNVVNLLAVSPSSNQPLGWVVALNKTDGPRTSMLDRAPAAGPMPFRRPDAAALLPFASLIGLQLRGSRRFHDLKDLLVGLTRSLTAAIDAKDSYTYGHSERVARIGVLLGRKMGLSEDELSDIYLAGLLHDIGKIGVRDTVLLKAAPLTPEEFDHIKEHVLIGHRILADLRPLHNLIPGVRSHHERYDGKGYPDGLAAENIPLLARILAVADSYDAMSAKRPYREGLSCEEVEERLRQGAGTQWDQRLIDVFLGCRQQVHLIRQRGVGKSLNLALEGALRAGDSSRLHQPLAPAMKG